MTDGTIFNRNTDFYKNYLLTLNLAIKYVDEEPKREEIFTEP